MKKQHYEVMLPNTRDLGKVVNLEKINENLNPKLEKSFKSLAIRHPKSTVVLKKSFCYATFDFCSTPVTGVKIRRFLISWKEVTRRAKKCSSEQKSNTIGRTVHFSS